MAPLVAFPRCAARASVVKRARGLLALGLLWTSGLFAASVAGFEGRIHNGWDRQGGLQEPVGSLRQHFVLDLRPTRLGVTPRPKADFEMTRLFALAGSQTVGYGEAIISPSAGERVGFKVDGSEDPPGDAPRKPEWDRLRRQLIAALPDSAELTQAGDFGVVIRCAGRHDVLGSFTAPGLVQDAATAARVRANLAADPRTRNLPRNVTCEAGCVRLNGPFLNVAALALAVNAAIGVDGVREVRADLPEDMLILLSGTR